jgi:hypothetical protein
MAYEIGYRRPPVSGRFKKGKSGNPKGRPKGSGNFVTILERELGHSIVMTENGKKKTITRMEAMVKRIVADALQGDRKALLTLFDILRRTGQLEQTGIESLLPDDYATILDSYVARRQKISSKKSELLTSGEK